MKLVKVKIRNFRCYKDEISIDIGNITALIGKNDSGKSAMMEALAIFFEEKAKAPDHDDINKNCDKKDVQITCEFSELPSDIILDANNTTSLLNEYLLNEKGNLEIQKIYNGSLKTPNLRGSFARANHPNAKNFNDLLTLKNNDLKERAKDLNVDISQIDNRVNAEVRKKIWDSADSKLDVQLQEIPLDSEDAKKIWEQLKKELPTFSLFKSDRTSSDQDSEAQDPMKAAVIEALKTQEEELAAISKHVQEQVETIAMKTVEKIREMDPALASELKPRFSPPLWKNIFKISLTDEDQIPINKRGSGVRRLILLNFFRAKAEQKTPEGNASGVIYAIEEPETSQHPNNQRMLVDAFANLADEPNRQVILSTHTPMLARTLPADSLRYIEVRENGERIIHAKDTETNQLVANALGVLADHDVRLFIGVEGRNDINFLRGISRMLHKTNNTLPDLYDLENKGQVIFFPMGGANLALWASRTVHLNIQEFYIQDSDITDTNGTSKHQQNVNNTNKNKNCTAVLTKKREMENYLHPKAIKDSRPQVDIQFDDFDDVPTMVAKTLHDVSDSNNKWNNINVETKKRKESSAKKWLNKEAVEKMTPELLAEKDPSNEVIGWLTKINEFIS